jgi:TolB protein
MSHRLTFVGLALLVAACEPADSGGGAGVGGRLAFVRDGALVTSLDSGDDERILTEAGTSAEPALSPNGQTVVFAYSAAKDERARGLQTIAFGGDQLAPLALPPAGTSYGSPVFSPDGGTVVFTSTDGVGSRLFRVDAGGGMPFAVAPSETDLRFPAFRAAGELVVLKGQTLALVSVSSGTVISLGVTSISRPAVSPDGAFVAYATATSPSRIVVRRLSDGTETPLAMTGEGDVNPAFAPDGLFVGFESKSAGGLQPLLYAAKVDGSGAPVLLQSGSELAWSF